MTSMTLVEGNKIEMVQKKAFAIILGRNYHSYASALSSEVEKVAKPANLVGRKFWGFSGLTENIFKNLRVIVANFDPEQKLFLD